MADTDRRETILEAARKLFNQRGYHEVTMRDVADAVGIRVGNLTYYFAKKQDLMEAVVLKMHSQFAPPQVPDTLALLDSWFHGMKRHIEDNAYYYWHYTQLAQLSPVVREIQQRVAPVHHQMLQSALEKLAAAGMLRPESYPGQYRRVAESLQIVYTYWTPHSHTLPGGLGSFMGNVWAVLRPLLSDEGQACFERDIRPHIPKR